MSKPSPNQGCDLSTIDFHNIYSHATTYEKVGKKSVGENVLESDVGMSGTFRSTKTQRMVFLARMVIQDEFEVVYCNLRENLEKEGVIFLKIEMEHPHFNYPKLT
jgi:Fe-S cluster assembly scaffold protein SufB